MSSAASPCRSPRSSSVPGVLNVALRERPLSGTSSSRSSSSSSARRCAGMSSCTSTRTTSPNRRWNTCSSIVASRSSGSSIGNLEIGVARDPERVPARRPPSRERARRGSRRSPARAERSGSAGRAPAPSAAGSSAPSRARSASRRARGSRISTASDSERFEMYGNGWPGSTASGVSTGKDLRLEVLVDRAPLGRREVAHADESHAVRRELARAASSRHARCSVEQPRDLGVDRVELLLRRQAVGRRLRRRRPRPAAAVRRRAPCRTRRGSR